MTVPWLLMTELITGKSQYSQSLFMVLVVQMIQLIVIDTSQSTLGCNVDYEYNVSTILFQRNLVAIQILDSESIDVLLNVLFIVDR